jgi:hypothetical protein
MSIIVQDRAEAAILGEERIAAVAEQVEVERLVGLLLAVALDFDRDCLRRLAGGEGQRAGLGDVILTNYFCSSYKSTNSPNTSSSLVEASLAKIRVSRSA